LKKPSGSTRLVSWHQQAIVGIDPKLEGEIIEKAFVKLCTPGAEILQLSAEVAFIEVKSLLLDTIAFGRSRSLKCGIGCVLGSGLMILGLCTS
jgi:hypothetical protein